MASIGIDNVVKKFGGLTVLDGISVDVEDKEFVVLVGPSGCGKSTLLRMIAGLEDISGGEISIDGKVVNGLGPQKRDLAMVFQSYALYPHMTTEENMGFSLKLRGRPANEIKSAVEHAAQTLHLTDFLDRLPRHLSGGQRQRVAMGRAIVRDPRAFLFDEPLSNLDAKLRTHMRVEIRRLHQHLGATSIYVTHDQVEAMTMADRIVVMNAGRIEQIGTPIELYDKPANMFVAGFLGAPAMNFVTGAVESDGASGSKLVIASGPHSLPLPDGLKGELPGKLCVGVRPQDIELSQGQSGTASVSVDVQVVEQTGCETNLLVDIDGTEWTVQTRDRVPYKPGDLVHLTVRPESIHMFDCRTTERLS